MSESRVRAPVGCSTLGARGQLTAGQLPVSYLDDLAPDSVRLPPYPRSVVGDEAAALIFCPVVFRQPADNAVSSGMFRLVALLIRERMPVSRARPASQASSPARRAALRRSGE